MYGKKNNRDKLWIGNITFRLWHGSDYLQGLEASVNFAFNDCQIFFVWWQINKSQNKKVLTNFGNNFLIPAIPSHNLIRQNMLQVLY